MIKWSVETRKLPDLLAAVLLQGGRCMLAFRSSVEPERSSISRFYFGPDIRDAASPDFIAFAFCPDTYPL